MLFLSLYTETENSKELRKDGDNTVKRMRRVVAASVQGQMNTLR